MSKGKKSLLSIVLCFYNAAAYFEETCHSMQNQALGRQKETEMAVYGATAISSVGLTLLAGWLFQKYSIQTRFLGLRQLPKFLQNGGWLSLCIAVCSLLPAAVVSGLRYGIGTDYFYTYVPMFDEVKAWTAIGYRGYGNPYGYFIEPGMWELIRFIQALGGNSFSLFFVTAFIIAGFFWLGIYQNSELPWYSVALFFLAELFFVSMNAVQQYMALAIVFFGLRHIKKPCFWKYALCVGAATLFHYSAIILLPLYLFSKFKFNPLIGVGVVVVLSLLNELLQGFLESIISQTSYAWYWGSEFHQMNRFYTGKMSIHILVLALALYYYYKTSQNQQNPLFRFLLYCQLALTFLLMNRNLIPLADRIGWYLEGFQLLLLPALATSEKTRWLRWAVIGIPALLWGQLCYSEIFVYGWHAVVPYQSVLFLPS